MSGKTVTLPFDEWKALDDFKTNYQETKTEQQWRECVEGLQKELDRKDEMVRTGVRAEHVYHYSKAGSIVGAIMATIFTALTLCGILLWGWGWWSVIPGIFTMISCVFAGEDV